MYIYIYMPSQFVKNIWTAGNMQNCEYGHCVNITKVGDHGLSYKWR